MIKKYGYKYTIHSPIDNLTGNIEKLDLSNYNIEKIAAHKFDDMSLYTNISEIIIPNSVKTIGDYSFASCDSLTSFEIPEGLEEIGYKAFAGCSSLTTVIIPISVKRIGSDAFSGCSNLTIYCEAESKPSGWNSNWNSSLRPVYWNMGEDRVIEDGEFEYILKNGSLTVSKYIGNNTSVSIPKTVTEGGFSYTVTKIGQDAFGGNTSLQTINIPNSVKIIDKIAFASCSNLRNVKIPNGVEEILDGAFMNIDSISEISVSVKKIGQYAFYGAYAGGTWGDTITYTGTMEQWNQITLGTSWNPKSGSGSLYIKCSNGTITL